MHNLAFVYKCFLYYRLSDEDKNIATQKEKNNSLRTFLTFREECQTHTGFPPQTEKLRNEHSRMLTLVSQLMFLPRLGLNLQPPSSVTPGSTPNPVSRSGFLCLAAESCFISHYFPALAMHLPPREPPFHRTPQAAMQNLLLKPVFPERR